MRNEDSAEFLSKNIDMATRKFIQIAGPNPILTPGPDGSWDEGVVEACDIFKDHDTYYLYYHGTSRSTSYQIGVATASNPLGPWKKHENNPIVTFEPDDPPEARSVGCAGIMKQGLDTYYMWYSHRAGNDKWNVHLAVASNPFGPWEKHKNNPIIADFGYVGGVVAVDGRYYMYSEYPIGSTGNDYGPISLATANSPEDGWTKFDRGPVLSPGGWGAWDDGGFSEAKVVYRDGVFHMFYGGAKLHPTRMCTKESIGYAYSFDGYNFIKHPNNPVALREHCPDASALAEVHAHFEPPFIYLFHTLRYNSREGAEDLGVQILATQRPFRLNMPVLTVDNIEAGQTTCADNCPPIALDATSALAVTIECAYHAQANAPLAVHVRASADGLTYDTEDLYCIDLPCRPNQTVRKTHETTPRTSFVKFLVENTDDTHPVGNVKICATLVG